MSETESIDRLFLELSQFTKAQTKRELDLSDKLSRSIDYKAHIREMSVLQKIIFQIGVGHPEHHKSWECKECDAMRSRISEALNQ